MSLALNSAVRAFSPIPSRPTFSSPSHELLLSCLSFAGRERERERERDRERERERGGEEERREREATAVTHMLQQPFAFKSFVYGPRRFIGCTPIYI